MPIEQRVMSSPAKIGAKNPSGTIGAKQAAPEDEAPAPKSRKKLILIVLAAVLVLGVLGQALRRREATWAAALVGTAALGFAWAEWNEPPFALADPESVAGLLGGIAAGMVGALAAHLFVGGSVRAGGSVAIVGAAVATAALALNAAAFYVPFVGYVVLAAAGFVVLRLRRRSREKYKGLRILT